MLKANVYSKRKKCAVGIHQEKKDDFYFEVIGGWYAPSVFFWQKLTRNWKFLQAYSVKLVFIIPYDLICIANTIYEVQLKILRKNLVDMLRFTD